MKEKFSLYVLMGIYISDTVYIYIALNQTINLFVITEEVNNDCYSIMRFSGPWNRDGVP